MISKKDELEYAWKWFEFHADQRLRAFYYYLIIIGALGYGYLFCLNSDNKVSVSSLAPLLGFLGALISVAFLIIEIRNVDLVNIGRDELRRLNLKPSIINHDYYKSNCLRGFISHKFCLRFVYLAVFFICLFLFLDGSSHWRWWLPFISFIMLVLSVCEESFLKLINPLRWKEKREQ